jgi:hypothetical protein
MSEIWKSICFQVGDLVVIATNRYQCFHVLQESSGPEIYDIAIGWLASEPCRPFQAVLLHGTIFTSNKVIYRDLSRFESPDSLFILAIKSLGDIDLASGSRTLHSQRHRSLRVLIIYPRLNISGISLNYFGKWLLFMDSDIWRVVLEAQA